MQWQGPMFKLAQYEIELFGSYMHRNIVQNECWGFFTRKENAARGTKSWYKQNNLYRIDGKDTSSLPELLFLHMLSAICFSLIL